MIHPQLVKFMIAITILISFPLSQPGAEPLPTLSIAEKLPIQLKGDSFDDFKPVIQAWFKKSYSAFNERDPGWKSFIWFLAKHPQTNKQGGKEVSTKYYNIAAQNLNVYQSLSKALEKSGHPESYLNDWRKYYAFRLIELRMPLEEQEELHRIAQLPPGTLKSIRDHQSFMAALPKLEPLKLIGAMDRLAEINPALQKVGYYRLPKGELSSETWPHVALSLKDGRTHIALYRLSSSAQLLIPDLKWFSGLPSVVIPDVLLADKVKSVTYLEVELENADPSSRMLLTLVVIGDQIDNAYVTYPYSNNITHDVIPLHTILIDAPSGSWFELKGKSIEGWGDLVVGPNPEDFWPLSISAQITGYEITGKFTLKKSKGTLRGSIRHDRTHQKISKTASWPNWLGPHNDGSASSLDEPLIHELASARLAWVSNEPIPDGRGQDARGKPVAWPPGLPIMGGWASPLVHQGKVYLYYYVPSGDDYANGAGAKAKDGNEERYRICRIHADDVLHCFDASTGETLWKRTYPKNGINWSGFNKGGPQLTPAMDDKQIYILGSAGRVYAVDAENGDAVWETDIGPRYELIEATRKVLVEEGELFTTRNDFQSNVTVVNGVVVVGDHRRTKRDYRYEVDNGIIGLDAQTGKQIWTLPEVCGASGFIQGAQVVTVKNKKYLITGSDKLGVSLIDPETGKMIDRVSNMTVPHTGFAVAGDRVVMKRIVPRNASEDGQPNIYAFRCTDVGFQPIWKLAAKYNGMVGGGLYLEGRLYLQVTEPEKQILCVEPESGKILAAVPADIARGEHCPYIIGGSGRIITCLDRTQGLILADSDPGLMKESLDVWPVRLATGYCGSVLPAFVDGRLMIRLPGRLICLDLRKSNAVFPTTTFPPASPKTETPQKKSRPALSIDDLLDQDVPVGK